MVIAAGMDIGAITVKTMIVDDGGIRSTSIFETGVSPLKTATESLQSALEIASLSYKDLSCIVTTGHGRNKVPFSNLTRSEISSIARGARVVDPEPKILIDLGGQGIRVIKLEDDGSVDKFVNNDKCSAGTGCFLDTLAVALGVRLDELGELSKMSSSPSCMSTKCTIFAESEMVSPVARGTSKEDIIAGLHQSVAQKVEGLVKAIGPEGNILFCGGVARNSGVAEEMRKVFGNRLRIPQYPQLVTVLGAAIYGLEFRGGLVQ